MAKETYYFSHDSNALTDTKILNMRADYGLEGYGLYWAIIEMMRNEEDYKLNLNKNTYRAIKTLTNTSIDIEKFIKDCIEDYELFKQEEEKFYSKSLLSRMQEYERKKQIKRENGKLGGRPKKNLDKTEPKPTGFKKETIGSENETEQNQNKGKKRKGKENKGNKNKEKRNVIMEIYNSTCTNLPQIKKLTDTRNKAIDEFLKDFTEEQFKQICNIANNTSFLTGDNERGWKADFDFIMRIDKATAILEGKYNSIKTQKGGANGTDKSNNSKYSGINLSANLAKSTGGEIDDTGLI